MRSERTSVGSGALDGQLLVGRYRVARVVSAGASTVIVDAIDLAAEQPVTVKIVRPELAGSDEFRLKFRRLAEVSNALTHPNIASVLDWGDIELGGESTVFWTVEALGGGSLRDLLDRGRLLEPGQALVVGLETCRALDAAHQKGLFHTELTPAKMVFGVDRRLRVVDFGMARLLGESAWADAATVPTHVARYASPEQALGLPIDSKTDVYALSLVLIEAVAGSVPFAADSTVSTLAGRVDKLMPVSADLGPLASVLEHAGRPEAADRFTAAEFGRALVQAASKLPRPEPIPILATGSFDTAAMRRPDDPTGGVQRPAAAVEPVESAADEVLVAADEADPGQSPDESIAGDVTAGGGTVGDDTGGTADGAVAGGAVLGGAVLGGAVIDDPPSRDDGDTVVVPVVGDADADGPAAVTAGAPGVTGDPIPGTDDASGATSEHADATSGDEPTVVVARVSPPSADESIVIVPRMSPPPVDVPETAGVSVDATSVDSQPPTTDGATEQMPASVVASARVATTPTEALGVQTPATAAAPRIFDDPLDDLPPAGPGSGEVYDERAPRRRKGPIILLVLVLLAGLGALGYAGSLLLATKSFEIPVLAGTPDGLALNQIEGNGWEIAIERERSDEYPEPDTVIRTQPAAGVELDEGDTITLVLSDGFEFRTLPDVAGAPVDAATAELEALMLGVVEAGERVFSEDVPVGTVISWQVMGDATLAAGAQVLPGDTVELTVSKGPAPRDVPDVANQTIDEATATLGALQLEVAAGEDVFSETVEPGRIVSQSPAPGTQLDRGGAVTVQLSKGPDLIALPDVSGLSFADAQTQLLENGFVIGSLLGTTDGTFVELTIDGEEVAPGTLFRRGQTVDLIFL